jgi:adenosylcobinamide kinase / adenosylcobinamide-phosphate guanylyltransferase
MARIVMVAGGSRSGKSAVAEARLAGCGRAAYVATFEVLDEEIAARVAAHRARRPAHWQTIEAPHDLVAGLGEVAGDAGGVLVDCLTGFLSNRLLAAEHAACAGGAEAKDATGPEAVRAVDLSPLLAEVDRFLDAARAHPANEIVVVTNEVGCGVVPPSELGRRFRDLQGWANQRLAAAADEVFLVRFGISERLK